MAVLTLFPMAEGLTRVNQANGTSWAGLRLNSGTAFVAETLDLAAVLGYDDDEFEYIYRTLHSFDTSGMGGGVASAATMNYFITAKANALTPSPALALVNASPANPASFVGNDWATVGTTRLAADKSYASITPGGYASFSLNATGLAYLNSTGTTSLAACLAYDVDNSPPTPDELEDYYRAYGISRAGTSQDPYLQITYTAASSGLLKILQQHGVHL